MTVDADPVRLICGVEFAFPDYKEPLVQLKGAVDGYMRGTLPYAVSDGRLPCAFCDPSKMHWFGTGRHAPSRGHANLFDNLGKHVRDAHGMSSQEYRDAIGLLASTSLLSRRRRIAASTYSRAHFRMVGRPMAKGAVFSESTREAIRQARIARGNSPENLNKRGICRDQIIAAARKIAKDNGGVLQMRLLRKQHIFQHALRRVGFADVKALAAHIGAVSVKGPVRRDDAEMLQALLNAAQQLGRTPNEDDLRGMADVPSASSFRNHFGTYADACRRAGLPVNQPRPVSEGDEIDILNLYSLTGSGERLARSLHRSWPTVKAVLDRYGVKVSNNEAERREAQAWAAVIAQRLAS